MYGIENLTAFILAAVIVVITPGIDTIMVLTRSMSQGKKAGLYSAVGVSLGLLVHTSAAAFGLSLILAKSAFAYSLIKYLGAAYLIYIGYKSITAKTDGTQIVSSKTKPAKNSTMLFTAFLSDVLNPKIAIFFLAFLPQFINASSINTPVPYLLLGLIIFFITLVWCTVLALLGSKAALLFNKHKKAEAVMNKTTGIVFILLGLKVALSKK
ncbi:threonine/homoserine/homoserine lactone efflux protein [Chryseobacterium sp. H1D6B]|uniref:LysE family translocator n=1 Tax=Chryseobacterium sp. H1D6B TaxID=2940588 RepID=UPI0015CB81E1|nr:LysE family translocator [Chryseobacterium sp. H1D6B]MDH6253348.1 threonine/homoserine/homoserine lactone efflux protein [Chryseobacterium sp. H1D6B]